MSRLPVSVDLFLLRDHDTQESQGVRASAGSDGYKRQAWNAAVFQELGSCPATVAAGKAADAYGLMRGNAIEVADAGLA